MSENQFSSSNQKEIASGLDKYKMDGHKLIWHLDRVYDWKQGKPIPPLHLDMGITTGCNMACTYCYGVIQNRSGYGTDNKNIQHMPKEIIQRTFSDAKKIGVRSIALIGEGENTLNPHLLESIEYGENIGLDLGLATNGIRIDRGKLDTYLAGLTWLRVNISAGTVDSFYRIHKVRQFERVLDNISALVARKRQSNYSCTIGLQMVVTSENHDDIIPLAKIGRKLGVNYLVVKPCSDTPDGDLKAPLEEYANFFDIFREAEAQSTDDYNVVIKWTKMGNAGWKDYPVCYGTQFLLAVSGSGNVFPCGHWFDVRSDEFIMGNLNDTPLAEIVSSERYWEVQKRVQTVDVNLGCESNCRQHYINQFLSSIKTPPDHVNFI